MAELGESWRELVAPHFSTPPHTAQWSPLFVKDSLGYAMPFSWIIPALYVCAAQCVFRTYILVATKPHFRGIPVVNLDVR